MVDRPPRAHTHASTALIRWSVCVWLLVCVWLASFPLAAQPAPVKRGPVAPAVGMVVPRSGEYAHLGEQLVDAAQLAAADAGVRLIVRDSRGEPRGAVEAVMELGADPNVIAIIGPVGQRTSRAAASAARRRGIPLLTLSSQEGLEAVSPWVFRLRHSPEEFGRALATDARGRLKLERAAILFPENEYGARAAKGFARAFIEQGGEVRAIAAYPVDIKDWRDPLGQLVGRRVAVGRGVMVDGRRAGRDGYIRLKQREPLVDFDALFIPDVHTRIARILPMLSTMGMQSGAGGDGVAVQLLGMPTWQGASMRPTGAHAAGAIYHDPFGGVHAGGVAEEFVRLFEARTGRTPVDLEAEVFDITWLVASQAKDLWRARKEPAAKLRKALAEAMPTPQRPWRGVCGVWAFGAQGAPAREFALFRFDLDGEVMPVD